MIGWRARLAAYTAVALLAWGAIAVVRPIPEKRAGDVINGSRTPTWRERVDSLARGETLGGLLSRGGLTPEEATEALGAATTIDPRRLPAGMRVTLGGHEGSTPTKIVFQLAIDRLLHLTRTDSGWVGREERLPWTTDTIVVRGEIARTLYDAFDAGASALPSGARSELAWNVADIYEYRLDMSRDLQPGDEFKVLFEREQGPRGAVRIGRILAASYTSGQSSLPRFALNRRTGRGATSTAPASRCRPCSCALRSSSGASRRSSACVGTPSSASGAHIAGPTTPRVRVRPCAAWGTASSCGPDA
ncbi:MAG TPA: hypothetical protein PLX31_03625 [Gemmatimonadaceae bacterium]|mgnify:CR=1 FL=1|nr:hypothetical protein [Gemmatimonadaceae bacterium]